MINFSITKPYPRFTAIFSVGALLCLSLLSQIAFTQTVNPSLLQRVRQLIGLSRSIAAGGSRSADVESVCVITPSALVDGNGQAHALVPLPKPSILAAGQLSEVRIERDGQMLWRQRASSSSSITGIIAWPIDPIKPGEHLTLLLRPSGASSSDFARITLIGASDSEMKANQALLDKPGINDLKLLQVVDEALRNHQVATAMTLLFAFENPGSVEMDMLKREILMRGCAS